MKGYACAVVVGIVREVESWNAHLDLGWNHLAPFKCNYLVFRLQSTLSIHMSVCVSVCI